MIFEAQTIPLREDKDGTIRVGDTRVTLDVVITAFQQGHTAETIVDKFLALNLADVYVVLAYYLNHQKEVDRYMASRQEQAERLQEEIEARPQYRAFRQQILTRYQSKSA